MIQSLNSLHSNYIVFIGVLAVGILYLAPGFLIVRLFLKKATKTESLILAFVLSFLANFFIVNFLVAVQQYRHKAILILYILFTGILAIKERRLLKKVFLPETFKTRKIDLKSLLKIILAGSITIICIKIVANNIGQVFVYWDAAISWNRWAEDWYHGIFPRFTWNYPQLIPANWSLFYQFLGTEKLQTFPKSLMPVFFVATVLSLIQLSHKTSKSMYLIASAVCCFIYLVVFNPMLVTSGYADVPVATFTWFSIYFLILAREESKTSTKIGNYLLFSLISLVAAALTKQVGLYMFVAHPILVYALLGKQSFKHNRNFYAKTLVISGFIFVAPFYADSILKMQSTGQTWEFFDYLSKLSIAGGVYGQLNLGFAKAIHRYGMPPAFLVSMLVIFSTIIIAGYRNSKVCRSLFCIVILPIFVIWLFFFSYQLRNLSIVVPLVSICIGSGLHKLLSKTQWMGSKKKLENSISITIPSFRLPKLKVYQGIFIGLAVLFFSLPHYDESQLIAFQHEKLLSVGNKRINEKILRLYEQGVLKMRILSKYEFFAYLPELRYKISITNFDDTELDQKRIIDPFYQIEAVLISDKEFEQLDQNLQSLLQQRTSQTLFSQDSYKLLQLRPQAAK